MMSREALFERMYNEVCDPWTLTDDEKEQERKHFYECLDLGDVHEYIESIEEMRDSICRPNGVHGCYDFEEMRKYDDLIEELKDTSIHYTTNIMIPVEKVTTTFDVGDGFYIDIAEDGNGQSAWIYHKGYGTKLLMFHTDEDDEDQSLDNFMIAVKCDISDSKRWYRNDVMDWE